MSNSIISSLKERGLIHDITHSEELASLLNKEQVSFYCGFDPSADSLHVGSLLPLLTAKRLALSGLKPVILIGTATGMIGDPSGKSAERQLLDTERVKNNAEKIKDQIKDFFTNSNIDCQFVSNGDWFKEISFLDFLRDVGKHFSANAMIAKDSVKSRLENREQGISYTEFSYMLLQAYDYLWLNKNMNCKLQIGGSDQWGNITAGVDLIRRVTGERAYGFTFPLLTMASGEKFGKTEAGTLWLDSNRTSPYDFYQYWLNTSDQDTASLIKLLTEADSPKQIELASSMKSSPEKREAQNYLADYLTKTVHGEEGLKSALQATSVLFGGSLDGMSSQMLKSIFSDVPSTAINSQKIANGLALDALLISCNIVKSKGEAKRLITEGGLYLNNIRVSGPSIQIETANFIDTSVMLIRKGKKKYHLVTLEN